MTDYVEYTPDTPIDESVGFGSYNNVERAVDLLPDQFDDSVNLKAIIESFAAGVQDVENLLTDILHNTEIEKAAGEQLDVLGILFGIRRAGVDDDTYRNKISTQILINTSDGTPNEIEQITSILAKTSVIRYFDHYPACFAVQAEVSPSGSGAINDVIDLPPNSANLLKAASPAGVGVVMFKLHYQGQGVLSEFKTDSGKVIVTDGVAQYFLITDSIDNIVYQGKSEVDDFSELGILSEWVIQDGELVSSGGVDLWYTTNGTEQLGLIYTNELSVQESGVFAEVLINE